MNKFKIVILMLILINFICCSKSDRFVNNLISKNNNDFWIFKEMQNEKFVFLFQEKFYENHIVERFSSKKENILGESMNFLDEKHYWKYESNDSTLESCAVCIYKILKYTNDTIFMVGKGYDGEFIYVRSKQ